MFRSTPLHEGRRGATAAMGPGAMVSIHATARGATLRDQAVEALTETVSIHAPARGRPLPVYHFIRTGKTGVLARTQLTRGARFDDRALGRIRKLSISVGYGRRDPPRRLLHACGSRASERSPGLRLPASFSPPPIR